APCAVQSPAMLAITSLAAPGTISGGQTFTVSATIINLGQATAVAAAISAPAAVGSGSAAASTSTVMPAVDLPGGQSATFSWSFVETAGGSGAINFSAAGSANDGNSGALVSSAAVSAVTQVQVPAQLSVTSLSAPAVVTRGQQCTVTMTVTNGGEAAALAVAPPQPSIAAGGGAHASTSSAPPSVAIAGGTSASFSWTYVEDGTNSGTLQFSGGTGGVDANSGYAVAAAAASSGTVAVQDPAQLVITAFTLPGALTRGQAFTVSMTLRNTGATAINDVLPSPSPPSFIAAGGAHASVQLPLPGAVAQIAPGASATLAYTFVEDGTASGSLIFSGAACGTDDVNAQLSCSNPASTPVAAVQSPPALALTAFQIPVSLSRGQTFAATLDVKNDGEATASGVLPDPPAYSGTAAHATIVSAPAAAVIPGGGSARFSWTLVEDGTSSGTLALTSRATGIDANTAAAVASAPATTNLASV